MNIKDLEAQFEPIIAKVLERFEQEKKENKARFNSEKSQLKAKIAELQLQEKNLKAQIEAIHDLEQNRRRVSQKLETTYGEERLALLDELNELLSQLGDNPYRLRRQMSKIREKIEEKKSKFEYKRRTGVLSGRPRFNNDEKVLLRDHIIKFNQEAFQLLKVKRSNLLKSYQKAITQRIQALNQGLEKILENEIQLDAARARQKLLQNKLDRITKEINRLDSFRELVSKECIDEYLQIKEDIGKELTEIKLLSMFEGFPIDEQKRRVLREILKSENIRDNPVGDFEFEDISDQEEFFAEFCQEMDYQTAGGYLVGLYNRFVWSQNTSEGKMSLGTGEKLTKGQFSINIWRGHKWCVFK